MLSIKKQSSGTLFSRFTLYMNSLVAQNVQIFIKCLFTVSPLLLQRSILSNLSLISPSNLTIIMWLHKTSTRTLGRYRPPTFTEVWRTKNFTSLTSSVIFLSSSNESTPENVPPKFVCFMPGTLHAERSDFSQNIRLAINDEMISFLRNINILVHELIHLLAKLVVTAMLPKNARQKRREMDFL